MMKAIVVHEHGGPEVLRVVEVDVPRPAPGQALVRHRAIGVNFIDTYHRTGLYPNATPHGLGMEAAGVVEAVGDGVHDVAVGDRVAYASGPPGAYAELRAIAADRLVRLPSAIDDERAAAMLLKGMTVEYLIRRTFRVESGMTVLFHAAAGGVGLIACQWLAHLGATVIGTVGSEQKAELARAHGCTHTILYKKEDFVTRVRELTDGRGVPVVYDSVGKTTVARSLDCLQRRGMLVGFGNASGKPDAFDMSILSQKGSLFLTRPVLFDYTADRADLLASASALFEVVANGAVKIDVHQRFPLTEARAAHEALESRETTGSTILLP
jgi:NADPH2:quinone reductase